MNKLYPKTKFNIKIKGNNNISQEKFKSKNN